MNELVNVSMLGWVTDSNLKAIFSTLLWWLLISIVAFGADYLLRNMMLGWLDSRLSYAKSRFWQLISQYRVLNTLGLLFIGLVFVFGSFLIGNPNNLLEVFFAKITLKSATLFNLYILTLSGNRLIFAIHDYYQLISERDDKLSWHSYIKIISFFTWIIAAILAAAYIFGQPPSSVLAGLGAISAITLLIFRDTILGIVSSIQANATSMVRVGDYISMPKFNLDGTVEEISINSVRIRNDDNTVTTLPTYYLTTEAVKNWEYMHFTGARRFRFSLLLDPASIKFTDSNLQAKILKINSSLADLNIKDLTNLGLYRIHLQYLLDQHVDLNPDYSNYIRTREQGEFGVPLEITGFTLETSLKRHDEIRSLIAEEAYALLNIFELKSAHVGSCKQA